MLPGTVHKIDTTPELLAVVHAVRGFRREHRAVTSKAYAAEWTDRIGRVVGNEWSSNERFERLAPIAGFVGSARVLASLDVVLEKQTLARQAGHSERWIRKALKHPDSTP